MMQLILALDATFRLQSIFLHLVLIPSQVVSKFVQIRPLQLSAKITRFLQTILPNRLKEKPNEMSRSSIIAERAVSISVMLVQLVANAERFGTQLVRQSYNESIYNLLRTISKLLPSFGLWLG